MLSDVLELNLSPTRLYYLYTANILKSTCSTLCTVFMLNQAARAVLIIQEHVWKCQKIVVNNVNVKKQNRDICVVCVCVYTVQFYLKSGVF